MKKITTFLLVLACSLSASYAQYYYNTFNPAGMNPGGLNTDPEQPFGAAGVTAADGYTSIVANGTSTLSWSPIQTIPFSFSFDGTAVTQYKVSTSGVLTFTTGATTVPSFTNASIPDANIPDKSVMIWGLQPVSPNDGIITKTHGTAPNRQHWINFASYSAPGASGTQWTYWGIVLEESTNNIYIVDLRTYQTPLTLTLGIQVNSTSAYSVTGAPNTPSSVTNGGSASDPSDNVYYEFIQGTRPAYDANLSSIGLQSQRTASTGNPVNITGKVVNKGSATIDTLYIKWSEDGGTTVNTDVYTNLGLPSLGTYNFTHANTWTPSNAGSFSTIEVWTELTQTNMDQNTTNDSLSADVFVNNGVGVSKNVLLEEFTTAPCQFCPDGAVVVEQILNSNPAVVAVGEHACFGTDAMTIPEASTYCSAFGSGAPTACIDRVLYDGETNVAIGRGSWASRANSQSSKTSPVSVTVTGTYNNATRQASVNINSNFVDYPLPGDLRVTLFVVEDHVRGAGSGYNQVNAYNNQAGHPYAGAGNPIFNYDHRHVLRDVYPATDAWGDNTVIPTSPAINTPYNKNYTFTLNNAWDSDSISFVGFVSYFNTDVGQREVLNVSEVKLNNLVTGLSTVESNSNDFSIYPNPTAGITNIKMNLESAQRVSLLVHDITGKEIASRQYGVMAGGNQNLDLDLSAFENGFYFISLNIGNEVITKKISVLNN